MVDLEKTKICDIDCIIFGYSGQDGRILCSQIYNHCSDLRCLLISRNSITLREGNTFLAIADYLPTNKIIYYLTQNIKHIKPKIIYYFAAEHQSAEQVEKDSTCRQKLMYTNCEIPCTIMNSCKEVSHTVKFVYASSALIFANSTESPQHEDSVPIPNCDYGISKLRATQQLKDISKNSNVLFYNLILYGHESIYRGDSFFTKKLISHLIKIKKGIVAPRLTLFNPNQEIDMGYAPEYMSMIEMLIDKSVPGEYIIASGSLITVQRFAKTCCKYFGIDHDEEVIYSSLKRRSTIQLHGNISKISNLINYRPRIIQEKLAYQLCQDYSQQEGNM